MRKWLSRFLALPNGIPSHDTFPRSFARLDLQKSQQCFLNWVRAVSNLNSGQILALDGMTLRQSDNTGSSRGAIHTFSAWATQNRLISGQVKVDDKSKNSHN